MVDIQLMIVIFLVFILGSFTQRVSGFGMGVVSVMILPYFWGSHVEVADLSNILALFNAITMSYKFRHQIQWKIVIPVALGNFMVSFFWIRYSATASFAVLEKALGVVLVLLAIYFVFFSQKLRVKPTKMNGVIAGALGGTLNSLFGACGPPVVVYLLSATASSGIYYATTQAYFVASSGCATLLRIYNGLITKEVLMGVVVGVIATIVGNGIGEKAIGKIPEDKFRYTVYAVMLLSGVAMLV